MMLQRGTATLGALGLLIVFYACDRFMIVDALITACDTGKPLSGVIGTLRSGRTDGPATTSVSGSDGALGIESSVFEDEQAILTLEKVGYKTVTMSFDGEPAEVLSLCLEPEERDQS